MTSILITIVMPCLNEAETLGICIRKALAAIRDAGVPAEVVVADNGSTDGSLEIAETYARRDPRIRLIRQTQFHSQPRHYNLALAEISSASKYCKIVQADDTVAAGDID